MNAVEEFNQILRFGYNSEVLHDIKPKLESYLQACPEAEKAKCQMNIELANRLIVECEEVDKLRQQYNLFHNYVLDNCQAGLVKLEYIEPYGKSYGVYIKVDNYVMELVFKPMEEPEKNEVRTRFYIDVEGSYKSFMIKKDAIPSTYSHILHRRRDYYPTSVRWDNWGMVIINAIKNVVNNPHDFLQMCQSSCPFYNDGTHKYKFWKTYAKVEISYIENTGVIQGIKKGEYPVGPNLHGGNGSYRYSEPRTYIIKYTVDKLSIEKPYRRVFSYDANTYLRELKDHLGKTQLPYKMLNSKLPNNIEVITWDMNKEPEERAFSPVEYNHDWLQLLKEAFKDL